MAMMIASIRWSTFKRPLTNLFLIDFPTKASGVYPQGQFFVCIWSIVSKIYITKTPFQEVPLGVGTDNIGGIAAVWNEEM